MDGWMEGLVWLEGAGGGRRGWRGVGGGSWMEGCGWRAGRRAGWSGAGMWIKGWMIGLALENLGGLWLEGWMEGCGGLVDGGLDGGGPGMDGGKGFLNRTEPQGEPH